MLIFCSYIILDWGNCQELKVISTAILKNNLIKLDYNDSKYNVMATWLCHVISLVIISNDIPLSPPIGLTHCFVPDNSPFWYTKRHSSIVGNWLSYIALLGSAPAAIPLSSYCSFDFYSLISRLLGLDLFSSGFIGIWITPQNLAIDEGL